MQELETVDENPATDSCNNPENSVQEGLKKTAKNKKSGRLTVDLKEYASDFWVTMKSILERANDKKFGKKVAPVDVIRLAVQKINEADISKLQEESFDKWDKIKLEHQKFCEKSGDSICFEDFLMRKLKIQ